MKWNLSWKSQIMNLIFYFYVNQMSCKATHFLSERKFCQFLHLLFLKLKNLNDKNDPSFVYDLKNNPNTEIYVKMIIN